MQCFGGGSFGSAVIIMNHLCPQLCACLITVSVEKGQTACTKGKLICMSNSSICFASASQLDEDILKM